MNKLSFKYTNEFGTKTILIKEYQPETIDVVKEAYGGELHWLFSEFKIFLNAVGYTEESIKTAFEVEAETWDI